MARVRYDANRPPGPPGSQRVVRVQRKAKRNDETAIVTRPPTNHELGKLLDKAERAREYAVGAKSSNTKRAYASDWKAFAKWAIEHDQRAMPATPLTVASYLAHLADAGKAASTIDRALVAISQAHKLAGNPSPRAHPAVLETLRGIHVKIGVAQKQKAPVLVADLRRMLATLPKTIAGLRDRALLLVGFAGAFRRSELVALNVTDVKLTREGLEIVIRRSKTDQRGAGRKIGIPHASKPDVDAVIAYREWIAGAGIQAGPVFRAVDQSGRVSTERLSDRTVARIVKKTALAAGLPPENFAGHSLRAGFATSAAKAGKSDRTIMRQTGHRSLAILHKYIRDASIFDDNAATGVL